MIKSLTDWLLYTSIFAACCATGLCMATEELIIGTIPQLFSTLHLLVFSSTLLVYNVHYLLKKSTPELSDRYGWSQQHKVWHYLLLAIGLVGCAAAAFYLSKSLLIACMILAVLSFSYSIPLLPFKDKKRLKDFGWIKILVLTTVWTIVTTVLPILFHEQALSGYPYDIAMRFVFMFTLCVAFDIRDMQTDMEAGIATLPNLIGIKGCYKVMSTSMILFIVMSIVQFIRQPEVGRVIAEVAVAFAVRFAIDYSRNHPTDKAYLGLVDGMMLLYAGLILLL